MKKRVVVEFDEKVLEEFRFIVEDEECIENKEKYIEEYVIECIKSREIRIELNEIQLCEIVSEM